jgi:hypothetical protein
MLTKIPDIIKALKAGEQLSDPTKWKNATTLAGAITVLVTLGLKYMGFEEALSKETQEAIVGVLVSVFGLLATFSHFGGAKEVGPLTFISPYSRQSIPLKYGNPLTSIEIDTGKLSSMWGKVTFALSDLFKALIPIFLTLLSKAGKRAYEVATEASNAAKDMKDNEGNPLPGTEKFTFVFYEVVNKLSSEGLSLADSKINVVIEICYQLLKSGERKISDVSE